MFGFTAEALAWESFEQIIDDQVQALKQQHTISQDDIKKARTKFEVAARAEGLANFDKKKVLVQYLDCDVELTVTSATQMWKLRFAGFLKTRALKNKELELFEHEKWVLPEAWVETGKLGALPAEEL